MAQRNKSLRRKAALLAKRYGIVGGRGIVVAILVVLGVGGIGALHLTEGSATVVERTDVTGAAREEDDLRKTEPTQQKKPIATEEKRSTGIVVHVDGAVAAPGVYVLAQETPRINDAVQKAGGLTQEADTSALNLAAMLEDGQKVHVPVVGEETTPGKNALACESVSIEDSGQPSPVNINSATEIELMTLPGIGEATASAIVLDRQNVGAFSSIEDLMRVSGIGEKKFAKLKDYICV